MKNYPSYSDGGEFVKTVTLRGQERAEIEWLGSEWAADDRYDKIRLTKFTPVNHSYEWDFCSDTAVGWIPAGALTWSGASRGGVKITPITDKMETLSNKYRIFVGSRAHAEDVEMIGEDPN